MIYHLIDARLKRAIRRLAEKEAIHTDPMDWVEQCGTMYCTGHREWVGDETDPDDRGCVFIPAVDADGRVFWVIAP